MKKQFNLLVTIILMLSLTPPAVLAEPAENEISLDMDFTDSLFKRPGTADKNAQYPAYMFNAQNASERIDIGGYSFILKGDMQVSDNNDVVKVTANESASVRISGNGETVKEIALIAGGYNGDETADITVNLLNGSSKTIEDVFFPSMLKETDASYDMGKCIVTKKSGLRVMFEEGDENVYLNCISVDPQTASNVTSVTISGATGDIFIAAANIMKYDESDLEASIELIISELLEEFSGKTFLDLNENSIKDAESLLENLITAKEKGLEQGTDENIEFAQNLKDGYYLFNDAQDLKNSITEITDIYFENGKINIELSDVTDIEKTIEDLNRLIELFAEYDEAEDERNRLFEIAEYFNVTADIETEKVDIEAVNDFLAQLEIKKYTDEAENLYSIYSDKTIKDITEDDLPKLSELLELYKKLEELGEEVNSDEKDYIQYLYDNYEAYQNSETPYTLNIDDYFTNDLIVYSGQQINPDTWVTAGDQNNVRGDDVIKQLKNGNKYVDELIAQKEGEEAVFVDTGLDIPFRFSEDSLNAKVLDAILLGNKSGNVKSITISADPQRAENIYLLYYSDKPCTLDVSVSYDDNSVSEESISVPRGRTAATLLNNKYAAGYWYIGGWRKNKLDSDGVTVIDVAGEPHLNLIKIPVIDYKKVTKMTFNYTSSEQSSMYIYAITEMPLSNDAVVKLVKDLYSEIVTGENIDTSDMEKVKKLSAYYDETVIRGIKIPGIDRNIIEKISGMVLNISNNIYRYSKDLVKAEIKFSVPVAEKTLKPQILIDGNLLENLEYKFAEDAMSLSADIPVTKYGGKNIKIELDKGLAIKKYPSVTLENNYVAEYLLPDYIGYTYETESGRLTLKNNSQIDQEYRIFAGIVNGDEDKIYTASQKSGMIKSGGTAEETINLNAYLNGILSEDSTAKLLLFVTDNNLQPLCEISAVKEESASPVAGADYKEPVLDLAADRLLINGYTTPGIVNAAVYDGGNNLLYAGNRKTDGYFEFDIQLNKENIMASDYLKIELGGDGFSEKYVNTSVYFPVNEDRIKSVNALANVSGTAEIEAMIEILGKNLSLNFKPFTELSATENGKKALAERLYSVKDRISSINDGESDETIAEKIASAQLIIKEQSVLEAIKENRSDLVLNNSALIYDDVMGYSSIDSNGVTLYKLYNTSVTKEGKDEINSSIMGKNYKTPEELKKDLSKAIMLGAVKYPNMSGNEYISLALTEENADAADMIITKYLAIKDKSMINKGIAAMQINSLEDIENYIKNYDDGGGKTSQGPSGTNKPGGNSGGPSVVTNVQNFEDKITKEDEEEKSIFSDVSKDFWGYNAIESLYNRGVIAGKGANRFAPDDSITRAEFIKMLCILQGEDISPDDGIFKDVESDAWYCGYVYTAYNNGWINGLEEGIFGPDKLISRQDICTILYRIDDKVEGEAKMFADDSDIAVYAKEAVLKLSGAGVINGFPDGTFKPRESCTRAQAASLLYNFAQ